MGNESTTRIDSGRPGPIAGLVLVVVFVALVHTAWAVTGGSGVVDGILADGDSYLRLHRVERLRETGNWFDASLPRLDAPAGSSSHWGRPLDLLLLLPALALEPISGFGPALYWTGVFASPVLHILTVLALAWAALPLLGRTGALVAGALTVAQPGIIGYGTVGHADHHILFLLVTTLALGALLRVLAATPERGTRTAFTAGLLGAAGTWIGVEGLLFCGLAALAVGLQWITGQDRSGLRSRAFAISLTVGLAATLLAERGLIGARLVEYDRLSIVHLTAAAGLALFWLAATRLPKGWAWPRRAGVAGLGAALWAGTLQLLYPGVLNGPMADLPPEFRTLFFDLVNEYAAMDSPGRFLILSGGALVALPWAVWQLRAERGKERFWAWMPVALGLLAYAPLAAGWLRWAPYAGLFSALALADLVLRLDARLTDLRSIGTRIAGKTSAILTVVIGPMVLGGLLIGERNPDPARSESGRACRITSIAPVLEAPPLSSRPQTVLASGNHGPEILYRTRHRVISALYHRGAAGIRDSMRILGGDDPEVAKRLIRIRRVDLILLCPGSGGDAHLRGAGGRDTLYARLVAGRESSWIRRLSWPEGLETGFQLYQVTDSRF